MECRQQQSQRSVHHHHVVHTVGSATGQTLYLDGTLRQTGAGGASALTGQDSIQIGRVTGTGGDTLVGTIDEVYMYNRILSAEDVSGLYNISWQPANLFPSGATVNFAEWSYSLPSGLEGPYRIYLRRVDEKGLSGIKGPVWTGDIDTTGPRLDLNCVQLPTRVY